MPRIDGPSRDVIRQRGDVYGAQFVAAIRDTLRAVSAGFRGVVTVDDLAAITREWNRRVDAGLLEGVGQAYVDGAYVTRVAQRDALVKLLAANGTLVAAAGGDDDFEIPQVTNQRAEELMADARNRLTNVGNEVWADARSALVEGLQNGEGIPALRDRVVGATDVSAARAETIARTEIAGAMNGGSLDQMKQIQAPGMTKEFIATEDGRTRPEHLAQNGEKVPVINGVFSNGVEPGEEPNCRCTYGFDLPDEQLVDSACVCGDDSMPVLASATITASIDAGEDLSSVCACAIAPSGMSEIEQRAAVSGDAVLDQMKNYSNTTAKFKKAISSYQNGADKYGQDIYSVFNRWLRDKRGDLDVIIKDAPKHVGKGIDDLDAALASSKLKADVRVYKGMTDGSRAFGTAWSEGDMTGVTWTNYAYSSTSSEVQVARNFTDKMWDPRGAAAGELTPTVLNIFAPKGSVGFSPTDPKAAIDSILNVQKEVMLPRGTKYRIIADHGVVDGIRYLDAEVLV